MIESSIGDEKNLSEETSFENNDDDLEAFQIPPELNSPKRSVQLPKNLRAMLSCAKQHENTMQLEAALDVGHSLISRHFPELPEVFFRSRFVVFN